MFVLSVAELETIVDNYILGLMLQNQNAYCNGPVFGSEYLALGGVVLQNIRNCNAF